MEIDPVVLAEYARRLTTSYRARYVGPHTLRTFEDRVFALHHADFRRASSNIGAAADLAVFDFSASQIVCGRSQIYDLLRALCLSRGIRRIVLIVHDHVHGGPPPPACGVEIRVVREVPCGRWWCDCTDTDHGAARLQKRILGTSMAAGIEEYAFDAADFVAEVRRLINHQRLPLGLHAAFQRPFANDTACHWLLRSLTLFRIEWH